MSEVISENVTRNWMTRYGLAYFGSCVGWAAPSQLLLGNQLMVLRPDDKETALSVLMMLGGAVMVVTSLITGTLSDRTRSRWGRRMPWILAGSALCALCLVIAPFAPSYSLLLLMWAVFQMSMAFVTNNLLTVGPDVAPPKQYGTISGVLGATYTLGLVMGTVIASALDLRTAYLVTALVLVATTLQMIFGSGLRVILRAEQQALSSRMLPESTPSNPSANPRTHSYRDYWWVFASRFVIHIGNYTALFYLLYYLADHIGIDDPDTGVMILTVIYAACTVVTSLIGGSLSDQLGKRKVFVIVSSWAVAAATLLMAFAHHMITVVFAAVILGLAWGVFTSVDQALINESLPSEYNRSRDISIMTLTVGITNMVAGGIAALALHNLGGYPGLYGLCAVVSFIGSLLVIPVRSSS
ncbi:MFS transporter [Corynebacterium auriscanis]|uniref:MFS transporter n=1 Tax=Corynebacterium auriscanis TaxID=99807 RepID=UPI003CF654C0